MSWLPSCPGTSPGDGLLEAGPGARHRQLGDPQTLREVPLTALRIAGLAKEAGIPDGVFNVLPGFGHTVGEALAMHMDVDCITFTGSTKIGKHLVQCSGKSNLKRAFMECGGKSPNIVLADAPDLDAAARSAVGAIFYNQGKCAPPPPACWCKTASSPSSWSGCWPTPANGSRPTRSTPPPASAPWWTTSRWSRCSTTSPSASRRAPSCCWGQAHQPEEGGYYIEPTIFDDVTPTMRIFREEIFGPVLAVTGFDTLEEAIALATTPTTAWRRRSGRRISTRR